jgi:hypothetical protein
LFPHSLSSIVAAAACCSGGNSLRTIPRVASLSSAIVFNSPAAFPASLSLVIVLWIKINRPEVFQNLQLFAMLDVLLKRRRYGFCLRLAPAETTSFFDQLRVKCEENYLRLIVSRLARPAPKQSRERFPVPGS